MFEPQMAIDCCGGLFDGVVKQTHKHTYEVQILRPTVDKFDSLRLCVYLYYDNAGHPDTQQ